MNNKKNIFRCLVLVTSFFAVSCSCKNNNETNDNLSKTNNPTSSNTNDGSNSSETMLVSSLPNSFTFQEKEYFIDRENKDASLVTFLGYLINYNDLDKWKDYDNNPDLLYAFDYGNSLLRIDYENKLSNRFEIFYNGKDFEKLAIKEVSNDFIIFSLGG